MLFFCFSAFIGIKEKKKQTVWSTKSIYKKEISFLGVGFSDEVLLKITTDGS